MSNMSSPQLARKASLYLSTLLEETPFLLLGKITEEESLFYYASKKYSDFFTVPPTKPKFLSEFTDAQKQAVIDAGTCKKDDNKCLLDYLVTGDPKFAANTATVNTDANTEIETLSRCLVLTI